MRKLLITILMILSIFNLYSATLSFSGGKSSLSLREGKEEVVLSDGATVTLDSLSLKGEKITLSGTDWRYVECEGTTTVVDTSRGLEITAVNLWYDRVQEILVIESWFEIDDKTEEISAMGSSMYFDMQNDILELNQQVTLIKTTDNDLMRCSAESIIYDREGKTLSLRSGATVNWNGDLYRAEVISVDLENDSIKLEGRIEGNING